MSPFENIVGAIHGLSREEKLELRVLLETELQSTAVPTNNACGPRTALIGLFANEPDMMDEVMKSVYEQRSRPLRVNE